MLFNVSKTNIPTANTENDKKNTSKIAKATLEHKLYDIYPHHCNPELPVSMAYESLFYFAHSNFIRYKSLLGNIVIHVRLMRYQNTAVIDSKFRS